MSKLHNRTDAGQKLAEKLAAYTNHPNAIVLALPRGGVPVGYEISKALQIPLDAFLVRKLGTPGQEELAMGAIAMGNICVFNDFVVASQNISKTTINLIIDREQKELARRNQVYRAGRPAPNLKDKMIILVDDGLATGATMRAAVLAIKQMQPAQIIVAVPVSAYDTYLEFTQLVDEVICLQTPEPFSAIGLWYDDFSQTSDSEVQTLLARAKRMLEK